MILDFLFPESRLRQLVNYAAIAAINAGIVYSQNHDVSHALLAIFPPFWSLPALSNALFVPLGNAPRLLLVWSLAVYQVFLAFWACWWYQGRPRRTPFTGPPVEISDGPLDGRRLQHPWWATPALMTASIIVACYIIAGLALMASSMQPVSMAMIFDWASFWPLVIGLGLGGCGIISGSRFIVGAKASVGSLAGVTYLESDHWLAARVHALSDRLELNRPLVGTMKAQNAFAMGRNAREAIVVIGEPLILGLDPAELDAVIGHELGHIVSNDMQSMQFAGAYQDMFGSGVGLVTNIGGSVVRRRSDSVLVAVIGSVLQRTVLFGSKLLLMMKSRSREFYADAIGAALTSPAAMIGAIDKVHRAPPPPTPAEDRYGYLMLRGGRFKRLLSTHPAPERRKKALETASHLRTLPRKPDPLPAQTQ